MQKFTQWLENFGNLKRQMMVFLGRKYKRLTEDWQNDAEIAIYYFANHYHSGQWSELYKILSTSPYRPGPMSSFEKEDEIVKMMYEDLEQQFGNIK